MMLDPATAFDFWVEMRIIAALRLGEKGDRSRVDHGTTQNGVSE